MTPEHWTEAALAEHLMDPDSHRSDSLYRIRLAFLAGARAMAEHLGDDIGIKVDPDDEFDRGLNYARREVLVRLRAEAAAIEETPT